jgi:predicted DNA-binding protein with PD1-like motif
MVYRFDGLQYQVRLDKGERLAESLEQFAKTCNVRGARVMGVGGALEVDLGFYDLDKKEYEWRHFDGLREIASLTGSLAYDENDKFVIHLHGVFSDRDYQAVGGHVKDLVVAATVELFVNVIGKPLQRKTNDDVGLPLLDL